MFDINSASEVFWFMVVLHIMTLIRLAFLKAKIKDLEFRHNSLQTFLWGKRQKPTVIHYPLKENKK